MVQGWQLKDLAISHRVEVVPVVPQQLYHKQLIKKLQHWNDVHLLTEYDECIQQAPDIGA